MKSKYILILSIVTAVLGFFVGRLTIEPKTAVEVKETIKYQKSEVVVRDTIKELIPYETFYSDTIYQYITKIQDVDTAAILKDYFLTRKYALDFSNDTIGEFRVDAEVNQNRIVSANSYIHPIIKVVERQTDHQVYSIPAVSFYTMMGTSVDLKAQKLSVGVDLKNKYMLGVSGLRYNNNYNYTIDLGIKF